YRVDMRLRPWGNAGALVPALPEYMDYLRRHARLWELQALVKARWIAGDEEVGLEFIEQAREKIFGPFLRERYSVEEIRREIHTMKSRIELELRRRQKMNGEVKSGQGSIRDVEFVTQFLQLLQGQEHSEIRNRNTLDALARLAASGLLPMEDYRVLADGYTFLRSVEHALQIMHNRQVHRLPESAREMAYLARRLGFSGAQLDEQLHTRYREHREAIREVYQRYIEQGLPLVSPVSSGESPREEKTTAPAPEASSGHCARMDASYAQTFSPEEIHHHGELIRQLGQSQWVVVEARPLEGSTYRVTIVGYDYPGELSLICGLFLVHGMNIIDGHIFTYESENSSPAASPGPASRRRRRPRFKKRADGRRKIVDVFTVAPVSGTLPENFWQRYAEELNHLVHHLRERSPEKAHGELARRVATALEQFGFPEAPLLSVDIEIDNTVSDRYTVLRIDAPDTVGFLYELTNALALNGIYIGRVIVNSLGERVHDTLFVCDPHGNKITDPHKQQQLRAATALVKQFTHLLPQSPNPEAALLHFRELVSGLFSRPDWPKELASLERPEVLDALARLLGGCEFLWEDFLRLQHAHLFPFLRNMALLEERVGKPELRRRLRESLAQETDFSRRQQALNLFKDREMFRIDMRYILGYSRFEVFSRELSDLAEVVVEAALEMCYRSLQERHGRPRLEEGTPCRYALCALGKFGGRELGFASDIELMLVYEGEGHTDGEAPLTNGEFFGRAVDGLCDTIRSRREGIFEIDLRLRPYGKAGRKAVTRASFGEYFSPEGPAWPYERQALVKLRPVAGDKAFGEALVRLRDSLIYTGRPFDVRAMRGMRERQVRQLVSGGTINAKFSPGGLVDVEYLVQALQITHGHRHPELRHPATLTALKVLGERGIIDAEEQKALEEAYIFLRRLIEGLRMVRGNARDLTVPDPHSEEFVFLARRLGYEKNPRELYQALLHHTAAVEELSRRLLP
ncbi:MAG: glutamine synthetase adenylyltransferase, partial [Calditrichaeota bacterium]